MYILNLLAGGYRSLESLSCPRTWLLFCMSLLRWAGIKTVEFMLAVLC